MRLTVGCWQVLTSSGRRPRVPALGPVAIVHSQAQIRAVRCWWAAGPVSLLQMSYYKRSSTMLPPNNNLVPMHGAINAGPFDSLYSEMPHFACRFCRWRMTVFHEGRGDGINLAMCQTALWTGDHQVLENSMDRLRRTRGNRNETCFVCTPPPLRRPMELPSTARVGAQARRTRSDLPRITISRHPITTIVDLIRQAI